MKKKKKKNSVVFSYAYGYGLWKYISSKEKKGIIDDDLLVLRVYWLYKL